MRSKSELSILLDLAGSRKGLLIAASLLSIVSGLLQIVPFIVVYRIVDQVFRAAGQPEALDGPALTRLGFAALAALAAALGALYAGAMCSHIAAFRILYALRVRLSEHVAKVSMGYHVCTPSGELKKIIEVAVEKIEKFIAHQLPDTVSAVALPLVLIGYLFVLDWRMALILCVPIGIGLAIQARMYGSEGAQGHYRDFQRAGEEMNATAVEYVRGMPAVKIFGITAASFLTFRQAVDRYRKISLDITDLFKGAYSLFAVLIGSLFTFAVPIGVLLLGRHPGDQAFAITFILFLLVSPSLSAPLVKLMYVGSGLREVSEGVRRIQAVFNEPIVAEPEEPRRPSTYDITFDNVVFDYAQPGAPVGRPVLDRIGFTARSGEMTALVGPSGGGKSTIANLLLRFWEVRSGEIAIGGVPIREIGTEQLMDLVSFVFQDVHLFYDTIEANIRMGNETASQADVVNAARIACCHSFIERLGDGYRTVIGANGTYLSGGEAQRIAIARALLKNAPILVLDEATAYTDAENEHEIQRGLAELIRGKTVLVIAHRLSTIRGAEQILVIRGGQIAERGRHDELLGLGGLYERMWRAHQSASDWKIGGAKRKEDGDDEIVLA